jgi:LysR family transcriptional regulator, regulator for metE and metH
VALEGKSSVGSAESTSKWIDFIAAMNGFHAEPTREQPMQLEIRHLKLVAAIAETRSVTRAGNRLHLTQSALSHQLRDAEETLGTALFERKSGSMVLTPAGERLLQAARTVLDELERAGKEIQNGNGKNGTAGVLRLSTECYTVYHWLPPRLKLFQRKFPAVDFQLVIEATDNPYEALLDGKLDLAIVCAPIRNRKIVYTPLFEDEIVIIVPPGHRLAGKKFVELQELAKESLIVYPPKEDSTLLNKFFAPAGLWPRKIQEVMLTDVIIEMVRGGLGVAALARWAVAPQLASGALVGLPLRPQAYRRTWSAAQPRDKRAPAYVDEFIRLLAEYPIPAAVPRRKSERDTPFAA